MHRIFTILAAIGLSTPAFSTDDPLDPCHTAIYIEKFRTTGMTFYDYTRRLNFDIIAPGTHIFRADAETPVSITGFVRPLEAISDLPDGFYIFILGENNVLGLTQGEMTPDKGVFANGGHERLNSSVKRNGLPVSAGECLIIRGKIRWMGNRSGTFPLTFDSLGAVGDFFDAINRPDMISDSLFYEEITGAAPMERRPIRK